MKKILLFPLFMLVFNTGATLRAQNSGEELFKSICAACHTINGGRLVGPDLSGIYNVRNNDWLISFTRSSQQLIKSGDPEAIAIFEEYNKIPMPDNNLTDDQIQSIINYIKATDQKLQADVLESAIATDSLAAGETRPVMSVDTLEIKYSIEFASEGRALFYGYTNFINGAPPCISCHNIKDQSILGGGRLALDLTGSYIKYGAVGVTAIINNPPFPAMKAAMINQALTENETQAVVSLLKSVGEQKYYSQSTISAGWIFFGLGLVFSLILLAHIYIFYDRRKIP